MASPPEAGVAFADLVFLLVLFFFIAPSLASGRLAR
jgi:hypothetical protein